MLVYALMIFIASSIPSSKLDFVKDISDILLHILEYSVFGFLVTRFFLNRQGNTTFLLLIAVLVSVLYGLTDEIHQLFTPGRDCSVLDFIADSIGTIIGAGIYYTIFRYNCRAK
jgi:VanZ family protein